MQWEKPPVAQVVEFGSKALALDGSWLASRRRGFQAGVEAAVGEMVLWILG